jgi:hypothetical protein
LKCLLIKSTFTGDPAYIELINFKEIDTKIDVVLYIGRVCNPELVRANVNLRIKAYSIDSKGEKTMLNSSSFKLFINLLASTVDSEANSINTTIENNKYVGDVSEVKIIH